MLLTGCADSAFFLPGQTVQAAGQRLLGSGAARETFFVRGPTAAEPRPREVLHGYWLEAPPGVPVRGTVVYLHGNDRNLTRHAGLVAWLPEHGYEVLLFDYRGYGRSRGRPDRESVLADALAAIDLALLRDPGRTVVWGRSLGGALAVLAAAERPAVRGVLVESGFAGWRSVATRRVPAWLRPLASLTISDGPDPRDAMRSFAERPVLIWHGARDGVVPLAEALELHAAGGGRAELRVDAVRGHRSSLSDVPKRGRGTVLEFLAALLVPNPMRTAGNGRPVSRSSESSSTLSTSAFRRCVDQHPPSWQQTSRSGPTSSHGT